MVSTPKSATPAPTLPKREFPRCRRASWLEIDGWADQVARRVRDADRVPSTIVALTRGGWIPSRLIADRLGVRRLVSLRLQHWGITATPTGTAEITEGLSGPVKGEDVLVIDDITDSGESLALATEHVREHGARRVESATFLHITHSTFVPTYFAEEIPKEAWVWVVFPWNYWEDLKTLAARAWEIESEPEGARRVLKELCDLDVTVEDIVHVTRKPDSATPESSNGTPTR